MSKEIYFKPLSYIDTTQLLHQSPVFSLGEKELDQNYHRSCYDSL